MTRPYEPSDLRKTNDRMQRKYERRAHYKARMQHSRDRRRGLDLLVAGVTKGWLR